MSSFLCNDNNENDSNDNDNIYFKLSDIIDNTDNNDIINTIKDKGWAIIVIDTNTNSNSLFNKNELLSLSSYISIFKKAFDLPSDIKVILILILILIIMMMIIIIILRIHLSFLIREV